MEQRVKSGIYGLDAIIDGGFRKDTIVIAHGGTGVGKTTFGLQYALQGVNHGEKAVYLSLEMDIDQIVSICRELGFVEIDRHIHNGNLVFKQLFTEDMMMPRMDILEQVKKSLKKDEINRIIIDPLTHFSMYPADQEQEKRKQISMIFQDLRSLGTTVITLEEASSQNKNRNYSSLMPLYLADTVLDFHHLGMGGALDRTIRIVKHRGSNHGQGIYPYSIEKGIGIMVEASSGEIDKLVPSDKFDKIFKKYIGILKKSNPRLADRLEILAVNWTRDISPEPFLQTILDYERADYG